MSIGQDMDLHVSITGEVGSVVSAADQAGSAIKGMEGVSAEAFASLTAALEKLDLNFDKLPVSVNKTTGSLTGFVSVGGDAARTASALGIESGTAAGRVTALAAALDGLQASALPIIATLGGIMAAFATFNFFKDSADEAGKLQQSLAILGATVRDQGGNWDRLKGSVLAWANAQEQSTVFSRTTALDALRQLTSAGTDLHDSMIITKVAEDAAAATGRDLSDVVHGLMEAEHGRTRVLAELGIGTRASIKDGMSLQQILEQIEKHMGGAAVAAAGTYQGSLARLSNAFDKLKQDIGTAMLPVLTELVNKMRAWFDDVDKRLPEIEGYFHGLGGEIINRVGPALDAMFHSFSEVLGAITGTDKEIASSHNDWAILATDIKTIASVARDAANAIASIGKAFADFNNGDNPVAAGERLNPLSWNWKAAFGIGVDGNGNPLPDQNNAGGWNVGIGGAQRAPGLFSLGGGPHFQRLTFPHTSASHDASGYAGLDGKLDSNPMVGGAGAHHAKAAPVPFEFKPVEDAARPAKVAVDELDESLKKLPKSVDGYNKAIELLKPVVNDQNVEHHALSSNLAETTQKYEQARAKVNELGEALSGHTKVSAAHRDELKKAQIEMETWQHRMTAAHTELDAMSASLRHHRQELDAAQKGAKSFSEQWDQFFAEHQRQLANDLADEKMTNAQKAANYLQMWQSMTETDAKSTAERKQAYQQYEQFLKASLNDQEQAVTKWADKALTLFDGFFTQGKEGFRGFADAFKKMLDDMLQALLKSELVQLLGKIFNVSVPGFNIASALGLPSATGGASAAVAGAGALAGTAAALAATTASAQAAAANAATTDGAYDALNPGAGGGLPSTVASSAGRFGLGSDLGKFGNLAHTTVGSAALAAIGGALIGQTVFGGRGFADVGGSAGGLAGAILGAKAGAFGGPLIALGGALLGSFIGSLFGNHFDPKNEPDKNDPTYGPALADLQGKTASNPMMANGQSYTQDSWTQQATKNRGWNIVFEDFVNKFKGKTDQLPASLQAIFPAIEALWGGASGQADFNGDGKDGFLDIGSGKRAQWTEFWSYISQYGPQIASLMDNYSPANVYDAVAGSSSASMGGTYTPDGSPDILHSFPDFPGAVTTGGGSGGGGGSTGTGGGSGGGIGSGGGGGPVRQMSGTTINVGPVHVGGGLISEGDLAAHVSRILADHIAMTY